MLHQRGIAPSGQKINLLDCTNLLTVAYKVFATVLLYVRLLSYAYVVVQHYLAGFWVRQINEKFLKKAMSTTSKLIIS
jgi:hypothetical protein